MLSVNVNNKQNLYMCSMRVIVHGQIDKIHSTDMSLNDVVPTNYMLVNSIK